jgi:hypothetical protein
MKLTCPNCYETLSLAALIEHDAAREAVRLALEFPSPLGKHLFQYTSLFKPAQRALSMDRFASILSELLPMIQAAQIDRAGRIWPAPQVYWQQAFESMWLGRDKLTLPLKSHGYLLEILVSFANKAEAKAETQSEQGRKYGPTRQAIESKPVVASAAAKKSTKPVNLKDTLKKLNGDASDEN